VADEADVFAKGIRMAETGTYEGSYQRVSGLVRGSNRLLGAYAIASDDWSALASDAGMEGARWKDPKAQDLVAKRTFERLYDRYGDWRLVAVAWKAGERLADAIANDPSILEHKKMAPVKSYARQVMKHAGKNLKVTKPTFRDGTPIPVEAFPSETDGMIPAGQDEAIAPQDAAETTLREMLVAMRERERNLATAQPEAPAAPVEEAPAAPAPAEEVMPGG